MVAQVQSGFQVVAGKTCRARHMSGGWAHGLPPPPLPLAALALPPGSLPSVSATAQAPPSLRRTFPLRQHFPCLPGHPDLMVPPVGSPKRRIPSPGVKPGSGVHERGWAPSARKARHPAARRLWIIQGKIERIPIGFAALTSITLSQTPPELGTRRSTSGDAPPSPGVVRKSKGFCLSGETWSRGLPKTRANIASTARPCLQWNLRGKGRAAPSICREATSPQRPSEQVRNHPALSKQSPPAAEAAGRQGAMASLKSAGISLQPRHRPLGSALLPLCIHN